MKRIRQIEIALEKAAKYVCTLKCGRCPSVEENFPCPTVCTMETLAWQCWLVFFKQHDKRSNFSAAESVPSPSSGSFLKK